MPSRSKCSMWDSFWHELMQTMFVHYLKGRRRNMLTVSATVAKNKFGDLLHCVVYGKQPHLVTRNGRNMAVIMDVQTFNSLVIDTRSADMKVVD